MLSATALTACNINVSKTGDGIVTIRWWID